MHIVVVVVLFSHYCVRLFVNAPCQALLFSTVSWSLLKFMSTELVMTSNHLILCHPLLLLPTIFPSIRVLFNESALHIRWPNYWGFSFSTSPAAAAKWLQSCPTLCDPIDGSPPGSPIPGILQARTLEWVAISFSNAWKVKVKSLSRVQLLVTPWTAAYQAPLPMGFSRQEYWSEVPLPTNEYSKLIPLGLTGLLSLQSKGLSRFFSNTIIRKHQFFSAESSLWSKSHIHIQLLEKP